MFWGEIFKTENGLLIIKNNNDEKLSEEDLNNLLDKLEDVDKDIVKRFKNDKKIKFDRSEEHKYLLNEYVKDTFEEWVDEYEKLFSDYDIEVKFINVKNKNID